MKLNFSKLLPSLFLPIAVGLTSGYLTFSGIGDWYVQLNHPPLTPPNWLFGPAWMSLYIMIGLSFYLFWDNHKKIDKGKGYLVFILGLIANFSWSMFFFGLHSSIIALIDIVILVILILLNIAYFYPVSKYSAYLLIPYLLWVCFATYLNIGFLLLN